MNIAQLIADYANWKSALWAIFGVGFFPQTMLRLIVRLYPQDHPRREELLGELRSIPYRKRPFWVTEQLETALADGLWPQFTYMLVGRVTHVRRLGDGVRRNRRSPSTFWIPSEEAKAKIRHGDVVRLIFEERFPGGWSERMWVEVTKVGRRRLVGSLRNQPFTMPRLERGDKVKFRRKHVIDIDRPGRARQAAAMVEIPSVNVELLPPRIAGSVVVQGDNGS